MRIHHWRRKEQMVFLHTLDFNKATTFRFVPSADFFAYVEVEGRFIAKGPNAKTISFFHARAEGSRQCWERIAQSPYVNLAPLILLRRVVPANLSEATRCSYDAAEIGAPLPGPAPVTKNASCWLSAIRGGTSLLPSSHRFR